MGGSEGVKTVTAVRAEKGGSLVPVELQRSQPGPLNRTSSWEGTVTIAQGEQAGWDKENLPERKGAWRKNEEGRKGFWIKEGFFKEWPHPHPRLSQLSGPSLPISLLPESLKLKPHSTAGNTGLGFLSRQTVSSPRGGPVSPALSLSQRMRGRGCAAKVGCPRTGWAWQTRGMEVGHTC